MEPIVSGVTLEALAEMAVAAEALDPSADGHQGRVAVISTLIAIELGLDNDVIDGVRIAGQLHDIGKVGIPSDALASDAQLSFADWELLKTHCQTGYEILAGATFKAPVAEMVLQHHERLDGSGYPAGLRGKEILLGSRIIAVADTLEDEIIRSSGGVQGRLDAALGKITEGRGNLFDLHVVDACRHVRSDIAELFESLVQ
jgi:HD-GYP domain-containing protein (c-di-GMP phosphodiesterase class II)